MELVKKNEKGDLFCHVQSSELGLDAVRLFNY